MTRHVDSPERDNAVERQNSGVSLTDWGAALGALTRLDGGDGR